MPTLGEKNRLPLTMIMTGWLAFLYVGGPHAVYQYFFFLSSLSLVVFGMRFAYELRSNTDFETSAWRSAIRWCCL